MPNFPESISKQTISEWLDALVDHLELGGATDANELIKDVLVAARNAVYDDLGLEYTRRELPNTDDVTWARNRRKDRHTKGVLMVIRAAEAYAASHDLRVERTAPEPGVVSTPTPETDGPNTLTIPTDEPNFEDAAAPGDQPVLERIETESERGARLLYRAIQDADDFPEIAGILGLRISDARSAARLTVAEVVELLNRSDVDAATLTAIEAGDAWPTSFDLDGCEALIAALEWTDAARAIDAITGLVLDDVHPRLRIGELVQARIEAQGITEKEAAASVQLDVNTLRTVIAGSTDMRETTRERIRRLGDAEFQTAFDHLVESIARFERRSTSRVGASLTLAINHHNAARIAADRHAFLRFRSQLATLESWQTSSARPELNTGESIVDALRYSGIASSNWANIITDRRERLGLSLKDAALRACVPYGVWMIIEAGLVDPTSALTQEQCAWALQCDHSDLKVDFQYRDQVAQIKDILIDEPELSADELAEIFPDLPTSAVLALHGESKEPLAPRSATPTSDPTELEASSAQHEGTPAAPNAPIAELLVRAQDDPKILMPYTEAIVTGFWQAVADHGIDPEVARAQHFPGMNLTAWRPLLASRPGLPTNTLYGKTLYRLAFATEQITGTPLAVTTELESEASTTPKRGVRKTTPKPVPTVGRTTDTKPVEQHEPATDRTTETFTDAQQHTITVLATVFSENFGSISVSSDETRQASTTTLIPRSTDRRFIPLVRPEELDAIAEAVKEQVVGEIPTYLTQPAAEVRDLSTPALVAEALRAAGFETVGIPASGEVLVREIQR